MADSAMPSVVPPVASKVAIAVAGSATVSTENLDNLLADWLMLDTDEEREFRFFLPADSALSTQVVDDVSSWLDSISAGYTAIVGEIPSSRRRDAQPNMAKDIKEYAQDVYQVDDGGSIIAGLVNTLTAFKSADGFTPYLMLAWGDEPDEFTEKLAEMALDAGIKVLDLTAGLDDLGWSEEEEEPAEPDSETAPDEPVQEILPEDDEPETPAEESAQDKIDWPDEAVDEAQAMVRTPVERPMPDLATTLAFVYQRLDFEDRANAANHMMTYFNRPLTLAVRHHLDDQLAAQLTEAAVDADKAAEAVSTPVSEPAEESAKPKRGKPRDTASDVVTVLIHEGNKTARIRQGRGRFKSGEVSKDMTRTEYDELVTTGGYTVF